MLKDELKRLRLARHLTQTQLGEALNVSQSTITSWERGTRQPTLDFIPTIAEFYGVSADRLLGMINSDAQSMDYDNHIPKTEEAKILSAGLDLMPPDKREKALNMVRLMFEEYFERNEQHDDNA